LSTDTEVITADIKPATRTYFSHNKNLQLIRVKPTEQVLPNGKTIVLNKQDYEQSMVNFQDGFLTAEPGEQVYPNPDTGAEEDLVTFLENHPRFGREFFVQDQQAPDPTETLSEMARLLATQDLDGLGELYEREEKNWARPQVLEPIRAAVESLKD
jgi:hypothetical protein